MTVGSRTAQFVFRRLFNLNWIRCFRARVLETLVRGRTDAMVLFVDFLRGLRFLEWIETANGHIDF